MAHDRQSVLAAVRSGCVQSALTACERYPDNEEIFKQTKRMVDILEATKMEILNELKEELDSPSPDANKCVRQLDLLKELHEPSKNLPPSFDSGLTEFEKEGVQVAVTTVGSDLARRNRELFAAAVGLLRSFGERLPAHDFMANSGATESLCELVENDPENEDMCAELFNFLGEFSGEFGQTAERVQNLQNWYMTRRVGSDISQRKEDLTDAIYENCGSQETLTNCLQNFQDLKFCYDEKNDLFKPEEHEVTPMDDEVTLMCFFMIDDPEQPEEVKLAAIDLLKKMGEQAFLMESMMRHPCVNDLYSRIATCNMESMNFVALQPFLKVEGVRANALHAISQALDKFEDKSLDERSMFLGSLVDFFTGDENGEVDRAFMRKLIAVMVKEDDIVLKAKTASLLHMIASNNENNAKNFASTEVLEPFMDAMRNDLDKPTVLEEQVGTLRDVAEFRSPIKPTFYELKVEEDMDKVMFKNAQHGEIFHAAARVKDLMKMALLNLNEDDIKRWNRRSQVKGMMMELFRGLTVMITFIFTKAEKEVRTGDSPDDIAMEVNRLLAEFE
eukprot:94714_1